MGIFLKINKPDIIHQTLYSPIKNHNSNFAIIITIHDLIHEKLNYIMRTNVDYEQKQLLRTKLIQFINLIILYVYQKVRKRSFRNI